MKYTSALMTGASGSLRGIVASHNSGGTYFRGRTTPVNPQTTLQTAVRNAMSNISQAWDNVLTGSQRNAWNTYAFNTPTTDSMGNQIKLSGINWYNACNVPRLQVGLSRVDAGPTNFTLANLTLPGITSLTATTRVMIVTFTNTDTWATAVGGALLVYTSRPQNAGKTFFKGPYQFAGRINGAVSPPTSPQNITTPFTLAAGQQVFVQFRAVNADGRISAIFRLPITTV